MVIGTDEFAELVRLECEQRGLPELHRLAIPHPIGGIKPPREFVYMDRAAIGLGSVFLHLGAEINWHRLFHGLTDDFQETKLAQRQCEALAAVGLTPP